MTKNKSIKTKQTHAIIGKIKAYVKAMNQSPQKTKPKAKHKKQTMDKCKTRQTHKISVNYKKQKTIEIPLYYRHFIFSMIFRGIFRGKSANLRFAKKFATFSTRNYHI